MSTSPFWLAVRDTATELPADAKRLGRQGLDAGRYRLVANPPRLVLTLLRRFRPQARLDRLRLVTGGLAVRRVLAEDDRYRVGPYSVMTSLAGPFALGQDGDEHAAARARLSERLSTIDLDELASWADDCCAEAMEQARLDGRLDVLADLAVPLATGFVHRFLGVPARGTRSLDDETWDLFEACFLNLGGDGDRVVHERGKQAADALRARLTPTTGDRIDEQSQVDLVGLATGALPTTTEAIVRVADYLLDHPDAMAQARRAAHSRDRDLLWRIAQESMRFYPQSPGLPRSDTVEPGVLVMASTQSAMQDPQLVDHPCTFRTDRSEETYLHFGRGVHRCLGEAFARTMMTSALLALVGGQPLQRAPGRRGKLILTGPRPRSLVVTLWAESG